MKIEETDYVKVVNCTCGEPAKPGPHRIGGLSCGPINPEPDMVNHPPHYKRGPLIALLTHPVEKGHIRIQALDVMRWIPDVRLANALKYIWRVGFGGKEGVSREEDIAKAIVYLQDYLDNKVNFSV